ncbi:MAG: hypothetical protein ACTSWN_09990 [Promethearchaeota archaeon]
MVKKKTLTSYKSAEELIQAKSSSLKQSNSENRAGRKLDGADESRQDTIQEPTRYPSIKKIDYIHVKNKEKEDPRIKYHRFRLATLINGLMFLVVSGFLLAEIVFNINRGDLIFEDAMNDGVIYAIPYYSYHRWLESLSLSLGIFVIICLGFIIINIALYLYYRPKIPDSRLEDAFNIISMAEADITTRLGFKEKFGKVYEDLKAGKIQISQQLSLPSDLGRKLPQVRQLPAIKVAPKMFIKPPGSVSLPVIKPGKAPPVPSIGPKKKKPEGPVFGEKKIFVRCNRCKKTFAVKIPKKLVLENNLEVVPISILHGDEGDKHILTVFLDADFKSRRDRISDLVIFE